MPPSTLFLFPGIRKPHVFLCNSLARWLLGLSAGVVAHGRVRCLERLPSCQATVRAGTPRRRRQGDDLGGEGRGPRRADEPAAGGQEGSQIADQFNKKLEIIKANNRADLEFSVLIDNTVNIRHSLNEVKDTLMIAFALVVLVIFFFFRNWLIAIRPLIDIPISLIATFFIMYVAGFSINILTLLAIVLATGLVVDDGIVVTENIFRKLEEGLPLRKAAVEGSKEIFFAVISTSLTLAVVFMPVIFLQGFVGRLFREFGVVLAAAVLISAFVSLTITPVLNVVLTRKDASHGKFYERTEPFFRGMENGYRRLLEGFLRIRWLAWVIIAVCGLMVVFLLNNLKSELAPLEDRSSIRLTATAPEGTSFSYMSNISDSIARFSV